MWKCSFTFFQQMDSPSFGSMEMSDSEILDELTTSRGELKLRTLSFREERHGQVSGDQRLQLNCFF